MPNVLFACAPEFFLHVTTVLDFRGTGNDEIVACTREKLLYIICMSPHAVSDIRRARHDVARRVKKFACHHSFGRPTSTK